MGVNLNYNYPSLQGFTEFNNPCSKIFPGNNSFSEKETQSIRNLIINYPNIISAVNFNFSSEIILEK